MLPVVIVVIVIAIFYACVIFSNSIGILGGIDREDPFSDALVQDPPGWYYYADRRRKWRQNTNDKGAALLRSLFVVATEHLDKCRMLIAERGLDEATVLDRGEELYGDKPNLKVNVTWSQREYDDLGLQYYYLRYKSIQRFTEAYNMYTRAKPVVPRLGRVVSLGGGPGYELVAANEFDGEQGQHTSVDLADWSPYVGNFIKGSFDDAALVDDIVSKHDYVVFSYVVYHYIKKPDIFRRIIPKVKGVFINERYRSLDVIKELEGEFDVHCLIAPGDMRQLLLTQKGAVQFERNTNVVFEDVPY